MEIGKLLITIGIIFIIVGVAFVVFKGNFPRLPGDILIRRDGFTFYFPVVTSIVVSIVLSVIFYFLRK